MPVIPYRLFIRKQSIFRSFRDAGLQWRSCCWLPPLFCNMWLDSSKTHSSFFTDLQLQSNSQSVLLLLICLSPCSSSQIASLRSDTYPQKVKKWMLCGSVLRLAACSKVLGLNLKMWLYLKCMNFCFRSLQRKLEKSEVEQCSWKTFLFLTNINSLGWICHHYLQTHAQNLFSFNL